MKLIIAGSRTFTDYQLLCQTLAPERPASRRSSPAAPAARISSAIAGPGSTASSISSSALSGSALGNRAGVRRNHQMAQAGDMLVAFWDGQSQAPRTWSRACEQLGKPVVVIRMEATA